MLASVGGGGGARIFYHHRKLKGRAWARWFASVPPKGPGGADVVPAEPRQRRGERKDSY